jgi:hypothetical protein
MAVTDNPGKGIQYLESHRFKASFADGSEQQITLVTTVENGLTVSLSLQRRDSILDTWGSPIYFEKAD